MACEQAAEQRLPLVRNVNSLPSPPPPPKSLGAGPCMLLLKPWGPFLCRFKFKTHRPKCSRKRLPIQTPNQLDDMWVIDTIRAACGLGKGTWDVIAGCCASWAQLVGCGRGRDREWGRDEGLVCGDTCQLQTAAFTSCSLPVPLPTPISISGGPRAFLGAQVEGVPLSSLLLLPWSLPAYRAKSFSLPPHPWGTSPKMRASETSSGQETPGDRDLLLLSWGYIERGLNLAILGRMPGLLTCSDLKPEPKITGRCSPRAAPAGRTEETGHGARWPARPGWGRLQKDLSRVLAAHLTPLQPGWKAPLASLWRAPSLGRQPCDVSFLFKITRRCVESSLTQTQILSISPGPWELMSNAKFSSVQRC